jgi:hypothetical protein
VSINKIEKEDNLFIFTEKPNFLTLLSGGIIISIFTYLIVDWLINEDYKIYIQGISIFLILMVSIQQSTKIDVLIKINKMNGEIYAQNRSQYWKGLYNEARQIEVLQKTEVLESGEEITVYKLIIVLDDDSVYEFPLKIQDVKLVIELLDQIKLIYPSNNSN